MFPTTGGGDQVSNAFAPIYSMIGGRGSSGGTQITGGGSGAFGLQPQGMQGNDLTQMQRSLTNLLGSTGAQLGQLGQGVLGAGMAGAQTGFGTMGTALDTLQDPLQYWKGIMGDPTAFIAPQANQLSQITSGALNNLRALPAGGYGSLAASNVPAAQAAQVGNFLLNARPTAATNIENIAGMQGQIGAQQGQLGLGVGGLGTTLTGQGVQGLQNATEDILRKMNINIQEPGVFQNLMKAIGTVGGLATGLGNLGFSPFSGGGGGGGGGSWPWEGTGG